MGSRWLMISLTLFFLVAAANCQESCWKSETDKEKYQETLKDVTCMKPRDVLKQLTVPEGYDYVYPSAVVVKDCSGHMCIQSDQECKATKTELRNITAEARYVDDLNNWKCIYEEVEDHLSCDCQCTKSEKDCSMNEVFVEKMCRCECQPKLKKECERKMREHSGMYMWDYNSCTCPCNNRRPCGTGEIWQDEHCRCVQIMSNEVNTN